MKYPDAVEDSKLFDLGLIRVPDGVSVFIENVRGSRLREDDILKVITVGSDNIRASFPDDVARLEEVRDRILGPREDRNAASPTGGTAFERMRRAKKNGQGGRSYSTALTSELPRQLTHPADCIRTEIGREGLIDEEQQLLKDFNEVNGS